MTKKDWCDAAGMSITRCKRIDLCDCFDHPEYDATVTNPRFSWTQPICTFCFEYRFGRQPAIHPIEIKEYCVDCRRGTLAGVYVRVDPKKANWPTVLQDDLTTRVLTQTFLKSLLP